VRSHGWRIAPEGGQCRGTVAGVRPGGKHYSACPLEAGSASQEGVGGPSLPRTHAAIGRYVQLLDALLHDNPDPDEFVDRIHWLGPATPVHGP
jgi:hypothetical protein